MTDAEKLKKPDKDVVSLHDQESMFTVNHLKTSTVKDGLPGFNVTPLFLDPENGIWVLYVKVDPGAAVPTHFHTGPVHLYTTKGEWYYKEYPEDVQTPGSYMYEPGGSYHTLTSDKGAEFFNLVIGANINFDENGEFMNVMDAKAIKEALESKAEEQGIELEYFLAPGVQLRRKGR